MWFFFLLLFDGMMHSSMATFFLATLFGTIVVAASLSSPLSSLFCHSSKSVYEVYYLDHIICSDIYGLSFEYSPFVGERVAPSVYHFVLVWYIFHCAQQLGMVFRKILKYCIKIKLSFPIVSNSYILFLQIS